MNIALSTSQPDCIPFPAKAFAAKLTALAHPARMAILRHLSGVSCSSCKDVVERMDLAQSTVSQHLKVLVDAGLVRFKPENRKSRYEIDREALADLSGAVAALVDSCCTDAG